MEILYFMKKDYMIYFLLMDLWDSVKSFGVTMKVSGSGARVHM